MLAVIREGDTSSCSHRRPLILCYLWRAAEVRGSSKLIIVIAAVAYATQHVSRNHAIVCIWGFRSFVEVKLFMLALGIIRLILIVLAAVVTFDFAYPDLYWLCYAGSMVLADRSSDRDD